MSTYRGALLPGLSSAGLLLTAPWLLRSRVRDDSDIERFPAIAKAVLVTIDVFDTALVRTLAHAEDVFVLSAWRAVKRHGISGGVRRLAEARKEAHLAALRAEGEAGRSEVTIEQIYAHHPIVDPSIRAALLAEELATERDVCHANPNILAIHRKLVARGSRVAFLSDTPFTGAFVTELLSEAGYDGPLEVYVSSEFGTTKASGKLFGKLANGLSIKPTQIWHIGDNVRSDVIRARRAGLHPLWYRPKLRRWDEAPPAGGTEASIARSVTIGTKAALMHGHVDALRSVGLCIAGPAYLAFVQWLLRSLSRDPVTRIFFLARDGFILKTIYERLRCFESGPPSTYLFVSRRSLAFPMIDGIGNAELDLLCSHHRALSVEEFFDRIGIEVSQFGQQAQGLGLTPGKIIRDRADLDALRSLFGALAPVVVERAREERPLLLRYLEQEQFGRAGRLAACDVGWNGTSQRAFASILSEITTGSYLAGYYVGTSEIINRLGPTGGTTRGWLQDEGKPLFGTDFTKLSWVLLELLFSAPHGSVINYMETDGHVEPVLRDQAADREFLTAVERIQVGALVFLDSYRRAFGDFRPADIDQDAVVRELTRLVSRPTLAEATAIGDVLMIEGLGNTRTGFAIAAPPPWRAVFKKPSVLLASYRQAFWRRGFMVRALRSKHIADVVGQLRRLVTLIRA